MGEIVVNGATLACDKAVPPGTSTFVVLPVSLVDSNSKPMVTIMDNKPMANIPPFGMCTAGGKISVKSAGQTNTTTG